MATYREDKREPWVREDKEYSWYSAGGTREVIIFVLEVPESPDVLHRKSGVLHRKSGKLTSEDEQRLIEEGISNYTSDADIMKAKYLRDKKIMKSVVLETGQSMNKDKVLEKIVNLRNNLEEDVGMKIYQ